MRFRRSCFCLLLCACTLFGLFSVGVSAAGVNFTVNGEPTDITITLDGASVTADVTDYSIYPCYKNASGQTVTFNGLIEESSPMSSLMITYVLTLGTPLLRNSTFDLGLKFTGDDFGSMQASLMMFDSEYVNSLGSGSSVAGDVIANKKRIEFVEVSNTRRDCKYIEIYIFIDNPEWTAIELPPPTGTFSIKDRYAMYNYGTFTFEKGMTWGEWLESDYNEGLEYTYYNNDVAIRSSAGYYRLYTGKDKTGTVQTKDTVIQEQNYYYAESIGSSLFSAYGFTYEYVFALQALTLNELEQEEISGGILGWIKNIFNGITNLPSKITSGIGNFFSELGNKVTALGQTILDGIKGLFIPSEQSITDMKTDFEQLLADRFGAVYESTAVIDNFANAFFNQAQVAALSEGGGTIKFPLVTVPLAGTEFTFGGWDVDIIPDGFQGIVDVLKILVDIVCTFAFVNAMRKRLEAILA